jgi:type VI secretion system protein VasG
LLGRLLVLPYFPLSPTMLAGIVRLQLDRIVRRVGDNHNIDVRYDDAVVDHIVSRCTEVASGGRMIDAILTNTMLPDMSIALLERRVDGEEVAEIVMRVEGNAFVYDFTARSPKAPTKRSTDDAATPSESLVEPGIV